MEGWQHLRLNRTLQVIFGSAFILFCMLAYGKASGDEEVIRMAGFEGIFCGASAMYGGLAQILNELYGRVVMPLGVRKAARPLSGVAAL